MITTSVFKKPQISIQYLTNSDSSEKHVGCVKVKSKTLFTVTVHTVNSGTYSCYCQFLMQVINNSGSVLSYLIAESV